MWVRVGGRSNRTAVVQCAGTQHDIHEALAVGVAGFHPAGAGSTPAMDRPRGLTVYDMWL